jgi:hypothetical protein
MSGAAFQGYDDSRTIDRLGLAPVPGAGCRNRRSPTKQPIGAAVELADSRVAIPNAARGPADDTGLCDAIASISNVIPDFPNWTSPVLVTLREKRGAAEGVGIERPTGPERRR